MLFALYLFLVLPHKKDVIYTSVGDVLTPEHAVALLMLQAFSPKSDY